MILPQDLARRSLYLFALVLTLLIAAAGGAPARSADASIASVGIGDGQTLSGSVTWTAQVSGTPNRVDFAIDGTTRWTEHHSPYTYGGDGNKLDTSTLADGPHTFTVTAYPTAGKGRSVEASVSATVSNAGSTPSTVGPASIGAPTISGTVAVGQALTASNGSWTGTAPLAYAYEWHLCDTSGSSCTVPAGATDSTFVVPTAAGGSTVKVEVTASNIAGSASAFSAATAVVPSDGSSSGLAPSPAGSPSISGSSVVGQTLTASPGTWDGTTPMGYGYQWQQCGSGGGSCSPIA
ncbi:MAG TPA: hypothetical protein VNH40_14745, partial [Gaiellaceae bacterium]|nr:hypothetical protein [Gaiellaceae bacterium]